MDKAPGVLYIVPTPIGNLADISPRVEETLRSVDFVACEDTRVTVKILNHLGIKKPMVSYYEHNLRESGEKILARILGGESCALTSDAGTPAISDPGELLADMCVSAGVRIIPIPGPCAAVTALSASGLPSGRFVFEGFLCMNKRSRRERLKSLDAETRTMIFYEAPHKLRATLAELLLAFGDRRVSVSRELTKLHEETLRMTLSEAVKHFEANPPRGEFVLVVEGFRGEPEETDFAGALELAETLMVDGMSLRDAVRSAAAKTSVPKNSLYAMAVKRFGKG